MSSAGVGIACGVERFSGEVWGYNATYAAVAAIKAILPSIPNGSMAIEGRPDVRKLAD
jgi:hypothetical protein